MLPSAKDTVEGLKQITKCAASASGDAASNSSFAQLQAGLERPLMTKGTYTVSTSPWSSTATNPGYYDALTRRLTDLLDLRAMCGIAMVTRR